MNRHQTFFHFIGFYIVVFLIVAVVFIIMGCVAASLSKFKNEGKAFFLVGSLSALTAVSVIIRLML